MKRKILKRTAGILLTMIMVCASLAGCSGKDQAGTDNGAAGRAAESLDPEGSGEERAMGRFLEEEVDTGVVFGNIYDVKKLDNGTLRIIVSNGDDESKSAWD